MTSFMLHVCIFTLGISIVSSQTQPEIVYEWETIDLVWPNTSVRDNYLQDGTFAAKNNAINGIKMYKGVVYLTIPKLKDGIPVSLVAVQNDGTTSPKLRPFPNWDIHLDGDCTKFRLIQSMEIDPHTGYMWIIDTSFVPRAGINIADQCPTKIIIWDLNNNVEIHRYTFPSNVVGPGMLYLNDIVLDFDNGTARWAYISDTLGHKIIVYDRLTDTSYSFAHASMKPLPEYASVTIGAVTNMYSPLGINGIAMSSDLKNVYYCPLAGLTLYRIPTKVLRNNKSSSTDFARDVVSVGRKKIQSDGLYYSQKHVLYYSTLGLRSVYQWPMSPNCDRKSGEQTEVAKDNRIEWVDSFAFDEAGYLWFVSNNLNTHFSNDTDQGKSNYFVWKVFVNDRSYLNFNFTGDETCSARRVSHITFLLLLPLMLQVFN